MFDNETEPARTPGFMIGQVLDSMSVEEIDQAIARLTGEIERLKQARTEKSGHLAAAESLFSRK